MSLVIKHYGVLGQKWGVRRYQPYPKEYKGKGNFIGDNDITNEINAISEKYDLKNVNYLNILNPVNLANKWTESAKWLTDNGNKSLINPVNNLSKRKEAMNWFTDNGQKSILNPKNLFIKYAEAIKWLTAKKKR